MEQTQHPGSESKQANRAWDHAEEFRILRIRIGLSLQVSRTGTVSSRVLQIPLSPHMGRVIHIDSDMMR